MRRMSWLQTAMRYESQFQTAFNRWVRNVYKKTAAFELKVTEGGSLPFSEVVEHQVDYLLAAKTRGMTWKIADDSAGIKPFDSFALFGVPAWVVIMFHCQERGRRKFVMIDIEEWVTEKEKSVRKSLTESRALEIGVPQELGHQ